MHTACYLSYISPPSICFYFLSLPSPSLIFPAAISQEMKTAANQTLWFSFKIAAGGTALKPQQNCVIIHVK